ncbi:MAG: acyltransferase [Bacteroidia bacterium]
MNSSQSGLSRIPELDALRGIAAIFVVFFHLTMRYPQKTLGFNLGITGVHLFFIISGFVIFMTVNKITSSKEFVVSRVARLFPTYWTCVTITFLFLLYTAITQNTNIGQLLNNYFFNLYMVQYYFGVPNLDNAYWTLVVELVFYVFIYILLLTKQLNKIVVVGCSGLLFVAIYTFILKPYYGGIHAIISHYVPLINHFPLFFAGILFYKLKINKPVINVFVNYFIIAVCLLLQLFLYAQAVDIWSVSWFEYNVMLGVYFLIFVLFVNNKLGFLVTKPTLYLGTISYALYLIHQIISIDYVLPFLMGDLGWAYWPSAIVAVLIALTLASLITFYIEKPLGKKMKLWLMSTK